MNIFEKEFAHHPRREVYSRSIIRVKPFDAESTSAKVTDEKKNAKKKYHGPESPLYTAIYPSVCITKVFGLAPYDFTDDQMVIVNYLVAMYELVATIVTRKSFIRIWNDLQNFDEKLNQLGYPRNETKTEIVCWVLLISQTIVWIVVNQSGMYAFDETWSFNISYMTIYIGTAVSVYKFFAMVTFLGQRFHQLNEIARENLPPQVGYHSSIVSRKTIQDLHGELMLYGEALDSLYTWPLLFWLINLSVHSVSSLYFFIDWMILSPWTNSTWLLLFNVWSWLLVFMIQLLVLHIGCDYTTTQANSMAAILVEWDARVIKRFPYDDTIRTSLHFLNRRLRFSAGGLFDVKLSLLSSIVGMLSTYLIILLQFPA
nr:PREDICTED: putative gustatory receptor 28a isoform X2 [Megachile rotundata]